jgi:two-component system LytT family sensor kinase
MKSNKKVKFWLFYHISILLFSVIAAMITKYNQTGNVLVPETILVAGVIFTMGVLGGYLATYLVNKASKLPHTELNKKILPAFIFFLAAIFFIANLTVSLGVFIWYAVNGIEMQGFISNLFKYDLIYANKSLFLWLMFFSIAFFFTLWAKSTKKEQSLREESLKYKYRTLKSQVNPHFLFNSLNTLSELIYSDVKRADNYIQKLSGIYRYILDNEENDLVPLEKELNFIKEYFELQKERDDDKISLEIDIKETDGYMIIPVSLQLLIENALKHNSISIEKPLRIKITNNENYIIISNIIQRKNIMNNSTHKGLLNLSERVKLVLNKELIVKEEKGAYIVQLPIIRKAE